MKYTVTYIFRKPDPRYKSIEGIFYHIKTRVQQIGINTSLFNVKQSGGGLKTLWSNIAKFKKDKSLIYHITGDIHYMALATGKNTVLTIHDVKSILKGAFIKQLYFKLFWFWIPALCVKRITVISDFTKKELEAVIPFAKQKIRVVHNPVNSLFRFSDYKFNTIQPKVLLLGTKSNKNLENVLTALSSISCEIVLIGKLTQDQKAFVSQLDLNIEYRFDLKLEEIVEAYKACDLLCFASTYEGFGMPIIEAQATGRPVITSNLGAMKEIAANTAYLVNPYDVEDIRSGLVEVIGNAQLRHDLIQKGLENVERFKSNQIAEKYKAIYKEISVNK
ncbi:glycosyltransferase family 4 protein [Winogradskyella eckloniae]|uniref:glycosyltransferase family 4 protein n=1 Tax=Winogradskyella eckloniae TaxID=1089306 RepID=UPI0015663806|nr:glycosyltransferase family 1 protein [Winogradskyella eckloniae]NRD20823.1 glycosyltransferase family 4 protein [Winogradskyella eckloniae]